MGGFVVEVVDNAIAAGVCDVAEACDVQPLRRLVAMLVSRVGRHTKHGEGKRQGLRAPDTAGANAKDAERYGNLDTGGDCTPMSLVRIFRPVVSHTVIKRTVQPPSLCSQIQLFFTM